MASGKNHDRSILFATPLIGIIGTSYNLELGIVAAASHLLGGLYLSPDLDLKSIPFKRWGIFKIVWIPYQKLIPCHRHWLSHGVIVGSIVRLLYLAALLLPLWVIFSDLQQVQWTITWQKAIAFFLGVELSALNHLLLDGLLVPLPASIKQRLKGNKG
jgi:uncharacterized metal-binding protein